MYQNTLHNVRRMSFGFGQRVTRFDLMGAADSEIVSQITITLIMVKNTSSES